jgi:hypothetical protein
MKPPGMWGEIENVSKSRWIIAPFSGMFVFVVMIADPPE